jgi:hypothetical protein
MCVVAISGGAAEERVGIEGQAALFRRSGIPVTLVPDCAVASIMEQVMMITFNTSCLKRGKMLFFFFFCL